MSDQAHKNTDKLLDKTERRISKVYKQAQKDIEKKTEKFFEDLERKEKKKLSQLAAGKITQAEYDNWRKGQMFTGQHWEEMKKSISAELLNANRTAAAYVNGTLPEVYALNYNAIGGVLKGYSFELVDAATVRNLAMSEKTLLPYKIVDGKKDERWNTKKVNAEIMQGIVQGESIPKIANRLQNVTEMNRASAVRNARTTVTSAENKGRLDSYHEAEEMGIVLKKVWMATHDPRTREAHIELDGVEVDVDEPFVNEYGEIMYPGDPDAEPANVYNCRCTMVTRIVEFKKK